MKKYLYASVLLLVAMTSACSGNINRSPNKTVVANIFVDDDNNLAYMLSFDGNEVLSNSVLGIVVDNDTLSKNAELALRKKELIDETYTTRGFHNQARNHCLQYTYDVKSGKRSYVLQTRVYDDGFAFRYIIRSRQKQRVNKELTTFAVVADTDVWFLERTSDWKLKTYAGEWLRTKSDSLHQISPTGAVQAPILIYCLKTGGYMGITEAALYNYSGMRLEASEDASLSVNFTENDGFDVEGDIITPWRVVVLAKDLNGLVNTDLISNLNPKPDSVLFADQAWIKTGRSVWSWWSNPEGYMTPRLEKHFVDRANELEFEYITLDEGWKKWKDKWSVLSDICRYAQSKNVDVLVWKHSDELNFPENDYRVMRMFLDSLQQAGVKGVKVDFMNGESKSIIDFDIKVLELAAERKMVVNFHGCQKPSGEFRTYPNELTREGIRGLELNKMNQPISAKHNVALLFTRCILNNSDYTPIGFSNPANTTWTHQLASGYAFTSPLITMAENPDTIFGTPEIVKVLPFIKEMPSVWDETIVLDGSAIGEQAIMARRKGSAWYLVVLNGEHEKELKVDLEKFLISGEWNMTEVKDVIGRPRQMNLAKREVNASETVSIQLDKEGGYLAKLYK